MNLWVKIRRPFKAIARNWAGLAIILLTAAPAGAQTVTTNGVVQWISLADLKQKWAGATEVEIQSAAEHGDLQAMHYLGYCHIEGFRFTQDTAAGLNYYKRAAEAGYLPSWSNLGVVYWRGKVVKPDPAKAVAYFKLAADAGFAQAQANLGIAYRDGFGVQQDFQVALKWFTLAAAQNHTDAMVEIGRLYRFGNGVPKDFATAENWFIKAAALGSSQATDNLALLYNEDEMRPDKAFPLFQKAGEAGSAAAMVSLYLAYWDGRGAARDHAAAIAWLKKAADAGDAYAECLLGHYYETPEVEFSTGKYLSVPDMTEAAKWYGLSAAQNWAGAQYLLGLCYVSGRGVEQDEERGLELIRQAADQHHSYAELELASLYARGIGEPRNEADRPTPLLKRVAGTDKTEGDFPASLAYNSLVFRFFYGIGTAPDPTEAARWYCRAALAGMYRYTLDHPINAGVESSYEYLIDNRHSEASLRQFAWPVANGRFRVALDNYLKAAGSSDPAFTLEIAENYLNAAAGSDSPAKAWVWFSLAAQKGATEARQKISKLEAAMSPQALAAAQQMFLDDSKDYQAAAAYVRSRYGNDLRIYK